MTELGKADKQGVGRWANNRSRTSVSSISDQSFSKLKVPGAYGAKMRNPLSADTHIPEEIYVELVQSVLQTLVPTTVMGILFVIVSSFVVSRRPDSLLEGLAAAGTVASLVRVLIIVTHRRVSATNMTDFEDARRFERLFSRVYIAFAILLGLFAAQAILAGDVEVHMVVAALIVGYAAGVAAGASLRPRIGLIAIGCAVSPLMVASFRIGDGAHLILALVLIALFIGATTSMLGRYRWTAETIGTRQFLGTVARKDHLTNLANRFALAEAYAHYQHSKSDRMIAIHCLDLDRFKPVNDRYGHLVGDRLLCLVGERLAKLATPKDLAVRLGGDEFALLQTGIAHADQAELVRRRILRALTEPYFIDDLVIWVGASVGSALADNQSTDLKTLLSKADAASYSMKSNGHLGSGLSDDSRVRAQSSI